MEMNVGMRGQPSVAFFVRAVVVQDHVQFLLGSGLRRHLIHELQKLLPPFELCEGRFNLSGRDLQSGKEVELAVTLVGALVSPHDLAVVGLHVAGFALRGLDAGFSSTQITSAFSGGSRYKPTMSAVLAANAGSVLTHQERWRSRQMPSQRNTRQTACTDPHGTRHRRPVPSHLARRGRLLQHGQNFLMKGLVVPALGAESRRVAQPLQSLIVRSLPPFDEGVRTGVTLAGDLADPSAGQTAYNHPGSFNYLFRFRPARGQALQPLPLVRTATDRRRSS